MIEAPPRATPRARYRTWEAEAAAEAKAHKDVSLFGGMNVGAGASSTCGSPFHRDLVFEVMDRGGMILLYNQSRNTYRVFGKVLVHDGDKTRVVENDEMPAPGPAVRTIGQVNAQAKADAEKRAAEEAQWSRDVKREMPTPEMLARWKLKWKELKAEGAFNVCTFGGECWPVGKTTGGCTFQDLEERGANVWYSPAREQYYILGRVRIHRPAFDQYYLMGKVRIHRGAFDKTVENGWIKVPGRAPRKRR